MKTLKITGIVLVVVLALAVLGVGFAFAQSATRMFWGGYGPGGMRGSSGQNGSDMMGSGYGMMGGYGQNGEDGGWMQGMNFMPGMHEGMTTDGGMHTLVWNSLAEALNLTPEELNAQLESGQTLVQIAEAQGVSQEQLTDTLEKSVKAGLEQAVADGVLTQSQAEAMLEHMDGNYAWMLAQMGTQMGSHMGFGTGVGPGGCHGNSAPQNNS